MNQSKIIKNISKMGYNEQLVVKALHINENNSDQTIELLKALKNKVSPNCSRNCTDNSCEYPYSEDYSSDSDEDPLDTLRNNSQFFETRDALLKMDSNSINEKLKTDLITNSFRSQLLENIILNQEMFLKLMTEKKIDNVDTMPCDTNLNDDDNLAIDRIKALGFSECDVVQAYFACDKDENAAIDLLYNNV